MDEERYVLSPVGETAIVVDPSPAQESRLTLDQCIIAWLKTKTDRTNSLKTERAYRTTIEQFRAVLTCRGLDLQSGDTRLIALAAQGWANQGINGQAISASTYNQRLAILSSFYSYAMKQGTCEHHPIALVDRRPKQVKDAAQPLDSGSVKTALQDIDRITVEGKRDYALLSIALATGRRASELAGMRWEHLQMVGAKVIVTWPRCKGAKVMRDELKSKTAVALLSYLHFQYGTQLGTLSGDAPIWVSFSKNNRGGAISVQAISDICLKYLGTSKVHSTRHTFAIAMEAAGAKLSDIGARLGHNDLKTTSEYMQRLHSAENAYASTLEEMFGI